MIVLSSIFYAFMNLFLGSYSFRFVKLTTLPVLRVAATITKLVHKMGRRATIIDPELGPRGDFKTDEDVIYEYHDDSTYKWICGFCDGENTTDEARCPICGYLRVQR